MASTDVADLRAMPADGLLNELEESQRALFNLRFQAATRQLADVSQVRGARRRVARIKTLLRERAILAEYGALVEAAAPAATAVAEAPAEAADEGPADEPIEEPEAVDEADEADADEDDAEDADAGADEDDGERE